MTCEADDAGSAGVTSVTAVAPLVSSGGLTPEISLPYVRVEPTATSVGFSALSSNTSGSQNTAVGTDALRFNTGGAGNTAVGASAMVENTTGLGNTAMGNNALAFNTTGGANTASGSHAMRNNLTGPENSAFGTSALINNLGGAANTAIGRNSLESNTQGGANTAAGIRALRSNTTGNLNTGIGANADVSSGGLVNATAIGANAVVDSSNKVRLGDTNVTVIEGQVAYTFASDRNQKENFLPVNGSDVLARLRGVPVSSWNYIGQDAAQFRHYGPMAQDFYAAFGYDAIGAVGTATTINTGDMQGVLMAAIQALEERSLAQKATIDRLANDNASLKARLEAMEQLLKDDPSQKVFV